MRNRWLLGIVALVVLLIGLRLLVGVVDGFVASQEYRSPLRVETVDPTPRMQGLADEEVARAQKALEQLREEAQHRQLLLAESGPVAAWVLVQLHLLLAGFILALPVLALILHGIGYGKGDEGCEGLARELSRLLSASFSLALALGAFLSLVLALLYPELLGQLFPTGFAPYLGLVFLEALFLYGYCHGWGRLDPRVHLFLGLLLNLVGLTIMVVIDARLTLAGSPAAVADGRAAIGLWTALGSYGWTLGLHRLLANLAFAGSIVGAYAAFRFLQAEDGAERASYDRMGHVGGLAATGAFLVLLFVGFWAAREVLTFSRALGVPILGGAFSWLFVLQAALIGHLLLAAGYYWWTGAGRIQDALPSRKLIKYLLVALALCFAVWVTPRSILGAVSGILAAGGPSAPDSLGVLSTRNTAVHLLILSAFMSFMLCRRAGPRAAEAPTTALERAQLVVFGAASAILVLWGVYGSFFVDAAARIRGDLPQAVLLLVCLALIAVLEVMRSRGAAGGETPWGRIPKTAQYSLIFLAVSFAWLMGLTGYVRSGQGLIGGGAPDALTSSLGFAIRVMSVTVLFFFLFVGSAFWLASLSRRTDRKPGATLRKPELVKIVALVLGTTLLYTYVGRLLPQGVVEPSPGVSSSATRVYRPTSHSGASPRIVSESERVQAVAASGREAPRSTQSGAAGGLAATASGS